MKKFTFIFGGVRSGKSNYSVKIAKSTAKNVVFIATASASDDEMKKRIDAHKKLRPVHWTLIEEGIDIDLAIKKIEIETDLVLIDCLGLFVTNLLMKKKSDSVIMKKINAICSVIKEANFNVIIVSNDVGSGLVPDNYLARRFRDLLGLANQVMAKNADKVIFMQVGIPIVIKKEQ
ncbi:MAG: bifunctional adenosylcobinamide kinase/adenosylcobinamide-phosphate guanylyltransferase [Candidatus Omnitrophica bacterium]|nr:bifunctional adenosylcobinamide kinase/adenosylcobinamide-phosphate guanylyltransferase [Candidatus Omnitrophota bacterium]